MRSIGIVIGLAAVVALSCITLLSGCGKADAEPACEFEQVLDLQTSRIAALEEQVAKIVLHDPCVPACRCAEKEADLEAQVLDLPNDANTWHTCLFVNADYTTAKSDLGASQRRAVAMFHSHAMLMSLKAQTHFHLITVGSPEFRQFAGIVDALPCLLIERSDGQVMYRESGPHLGKNPVGLVKSVRHEIGRHCPDGHCIPIHPTPDAPTVPDSPPTAVIEPQEPEQPVANASAFPAAIVAFLAALGGIAFKFKQAVA